MVQVNVLDARNRLSQLIKSAASGEEVVIANRGVPVARLVGILHRPFADEVRSPIADWLAQHPLPEHARRPTNEIEASIHEERDAWE